jgi:trk system potassium uptake protein TrkH
MFLLMGIGAGAMYVPAIHALVLGQYQVGRAFLYSGTLLLVLTGMIWLAWANRRPRNVALSQFYALVGAYVVMPPLLAVPMLEAVEGMSMLDAWFEMVSAFTTTGASLRPPEALPPPVHLWRALVGWFGGFFVLVGAATILAPMNLGGFELLADAPPGRPGSDGPDPAERLRGYALRILPVYGGLTLVLWIILVAAGEGPFVALCHAMGTLSTSGISPVGGFEGGSASVWAEGAILVGLCLALTRRSLPGAVRGGQAGRSARGAGRRLGHAFHRALVPYDHGLSPAGVDGHRGGWRDRNTRRAAARSRDRGGWRGDHDRRRAPLARPCACPDERA